MILKYFMAAFFVSTLACASLKPNLYTCKTDDSLIHITYSTSGIFGKPVFGYSKVISANEFEEVCVFGDSIESRRDQNEYYISSKHSDGIDVTLIVPTIELASFEDLVKFDSVGIVETAEGKYIYDLSCEAESVVF